MSLDAKSMATAEAFAKGGSSSGAMQGFPKGLSVENLLAFAQTPAGKAMIQGISKKTKPDKTEKQFPDSKYPPKGK